MLRENGNSRVSTTAISEERERESEKKKKKKNCKYEWVVGSKDIYI